jgi:hypothetical protein
MTATAIALIVRSGRMKRRRRRRGRSRRKTADPMWLPQLPPIRLAVKETVLGNISPDMIRMGKYSQARVLPGITQSVISF